MDANIYQNNSIWRPKEPLVIAISYAMDARSIQFRQSWRPKHGINQRFPKKKSQNPLQTAILGRQNPQNPLRMASTAQHSKGRVLTSGRQGTPLRIILASARLRRRILHRKSAKVVNPQLWHLTFLSIPRPRGQPIPASSAPEYVHTGVNPSPGSDYSSCNARRRPGLPCPQQTPDTAHTPESRPEYRLGR